MLLHRVELKNFRSLGDGTLDLIGPDSKPVQVMALIGPNGSGKTAWLDATAGFFTELVPEYGGAAGAVGCARRGRNCRGSHRVERGGERP